MPIGNLDRRVTIERPVAAPDSFGERPPAWTPVATVWAEVTPEGGSEGFKAGAETQHHRVVFRIRFIAGLAPDMRVVHGGRAYDIEDIAEPAGKRLRYLDLTAVCREVAT